MAKNILEQSSEGSLAAKYSGHLAIGATGSRITTLTEVALGSLIGDAARIFNDADNADLFFRFGVAGNTTIIQAQMFRVRPSGSSDIISIPVGAKSLYIIGVGGTGVFGSANIYHLNAK